MVQAAMAFIMSLFWFSVGANGTRTTIPLGLFAFFFVHFFFNPRGRKMSQATWIAIGISLFLSFPR